MKGRRIGLDGLSVKANYCLSGSVFSALGIIEDSPKGGKLIVEVAAVHSSACRFGRVKKGKVLPCTCGAQALLDDWVAMQRKE